MTRTLLPAAVLLLLLAGAAQGTSGTAEATSRTCTSCHTDQTGAHLNEFGEGFRQATRSEGSLLVSAKVAQSPAIDGQVDDLWAKATAIRIPVGGGGGASTTTVVLKSVYTDTDIYFLVQYTDPTDSVRRQPWQKQNDSTWKQLPGSTFYEDKVAQIWNINITGFTSMGCFATCHSEEAGPSGKNFGNKYAPLPGELGDIWHWKRVRGNDIGPGPGTMDDQYVDSTRWDAAKAPEAGRKSDAGGGSYSDNKDPNKTTAPPYTADDQPAPPFWILDSQKKPFVDTYKPGDEIAGIIIKSPKGDRADITAKGVWKDGTWTLEYGRKRVTGSPTDVQFSDTGRAYYFGTAVFDNQQVRHAYSFAPDKLAFEEGVAKVMADLRGTPAPAAPRSPGMEAPAALAALFTALILFQRVQRRRD